MTPKLIMPKYGTQPSYVSAGNVAEWNDGEPKWHYSRKSVSEIHSTSKRTSTDGHTINFKKALKRIEINELKTSEGLQRTTKTETVKLERNNNTSAKSIDTQSASSASNSENEDGKPLVLTSKSGREVFRRNGRLHHRRYKQTKDSQKSLPPAATEYKTRVIKPNVERRAEADEQSSSFERCFIEEVEKIFF